MAEVRWGLALSVALMLTVSIGSAASAPTAKRSAALRGVVTTSAVGPIPFGASRARVRAWAGTPEFTSPPLDTYPIPRHDQGSFVMGYHCRGVSVGGGRSSCHTLFGFRGNTLTTFQTDSPDLAFASGLRPGMTVAQAKAREPDGGFDSRCTRVFLPSAKGTVRALSVARWSPPRVFSIYAARGDAVFDPTC